MYQSLRSKALGVSSEQLQIKLDSEDAVLALVTDWRSLPDYQVTIVATIDGAVSIYYSNGGGVIGAGEHEHIWELARRVLELANQMRDQFTPVEQVPETDEHHMRMTMVTDAGWRTSSDFTESLMRPDHQFHQLAAGVQGLITLMREHVQSQKP